MTASPPAHACKATQGARKAQEDYACVRDMGKGRLLCILADGMGGHAGGAAASRMAVEAFAEAFSGSHAGQSASRLEDGLGAANTAIARHVRNHPEMKGMGCTLLAAVISPTRFTWISVGDSLLFRCRGGAIERLNADHSGRVQVEQLVKQGVLSPEEALRDRRRNMLYSALTGEPIAETDRGVRPVKPRDRFLLASDGIETLSIDRINTVLSAAASPAAALDTMISEIDQAQVPRQDNATAIAAFAGGRHRGLAGWGAVTRVLGSAALIGIALIMASITLLVLRRWGGV